MNHQRGIATGWLYLIGLIVLLSLLSGIATAIYHAGAKSERAEWQAREARINAESAIKIEAANRRVRDIEQDIAQLLANESAGYQAKLKEKDHALQIALDSVATVGLFSHGPACPPSGGDSASSPPAGASGRDGAARAKLPDEDARFLLSEASRADKIVEQLTACQGVLRADRTKPN